MCVSVPIAWQCRTNSCVTLFTIKAEYIAMDDGVREDLFVREGLNFMLPDKNFSNTNIKVFEDNQGVKAQKSPIR